MTKLELRYFRKVVDFLKDQVPLKNVSVRRVTRLPKCENGEPFRGMASVDGAGNWKIQLLKCQTLHESIDTLIHEFAHVVRGIPTRKDPHDGKFFETFGRLHMIYYHFTVDLSR